MMNDELVKDLREKAEFLSFAEPLHIKSVLVETMKQAADTLEELSAKVDSLQIFADNISELPDCNTCFKKGMCEFMPKYGEYCRINCPHWLGEPPKEGKA